jgi:hypothetical protein
MLLYSADLPKHPVTGLCAIGIGKRGPIWPVLGGDDTVDAATAKATADAAAAKTAADAAAKAASGNTGTSFTNADGESFNFPPSTPLADMTEAQKTEYWREKAQKHEKANKVSPDEIKSLRDKAAQHDRLVAASRTEHETAIEAAKTESRNAALAESAPKLVTIAFKAEAKGVLTPEQIADMLEDMDPSKYLTDTGDVDEDKIAKKIAKYVPVKGDGKTTFPNLGQGGRPGNTKATGRELGLAEAKKRFGKTSADQ